METQLLSARVSCSGCFIYVLIYLFICFALCFRGTERASSTCSWTPPTPRRWCGAKGEAAERRDPQETSCWKKTQNPLTNLCPPAPFISFGTWKYQLCVCTHTCTRGRLPRRPANTVALKFGTKRAAWAGAKRTAQMCVSVSAWVRVCVRRTLPGLIPADQSDKLVDELRARQGPTPSTFCFQILSLRAAFKVSATLWFHSGIHAAPPPPPPPPPRPPCFAAQSHFVAMRRDVPLKMSCRGNEAAGADFLRLSKENDDVFVCRWMKRWIFVSFWFFFSEPKLKWKWDCAQQALPRPSSFGLLSSLVF